jgi:hypothetical protein
LTSDSGIRLTLDLPVVRACWCWLCGQCNFHMHSKRRADVIRLLHLHFALVDRLNRPHCRVLVAIKGFPVRQSPTGGLHPPYTTRDPRS